MSQPDAFEEPWQAEALALAMALIDTGRITKTEWAEGLGDMIKRAGAPAEDDGSSYYDHVLEALEKLVLSKALTTPQALASKKATWFKAYATTPHGHPVSL